MAGSLQGEKKENGGEVCGEEIDQQPEGEERESQNKAGVGKEGKTWS